MSTPTPLRILILTSGTGGGHNARAYAMRDWFERLYPGEVECRIDELIEESSAIGRFGVYLGDLFDTAAPFAHFLYWYIVEGIGFLNRWHLLFGRAYYRSLLESFRPQLIVSVHDFTNCGYFEMARKVLGKRKVRCVTYCGEFSGGIGYSRNWISSAADLFIARNEEARAFARRCIVAPGRSMTYCALLPPADFEEVFTPEQRRRFRIESLGLDADRFTVFLATGHNGANNHRDYLEVLKQQAENVQAIAICGSDEKNFRRLQAWKRDNPQLAFYLEGYSRQVHKLIQASDVMVARGGANTASKALFYGRPILFNCLRGQMHQERLTTQYFVKRGAAKLIRDVEEFERILHDWRSRGSNYQSAVAAMTALQPADETPESLYRTLFELAQSAAAAP